MEDKRDILCGGGKELEKDIERCQRKCDLEVYFRTCMLCYVLIIILQVTFAILHVL